MTFKSIVLVMAVSAGGMSGYAATTGPATGASAATTQAAVETSVVHRGSISLSFDASGYFEPVDPVEVRLRLKVFAGELTVNSVVASGAIVKKGDKLLEIDPAPLKKQLDAATNDAAVAHAGLTRAEADAKIAEGAEALSLRMTQDGVHDAETAVKWFEETDGPDQLKAADLELKLYQDNVADRTDELDQLKKMYKTEELTNATADIVTKRAVRGLEQAKEQLTMAGHRTEKAKTLAHWINKRHVDDALTLAQQGLASLTVAQGQSKVVREAGLVTNRVAVAAADEKLADLKGDLEKLTVVAPQDGMVWYGQIAGGNWVNGGPKAIRAGEKTTAQTILMTLYTPGKLRLVTDLGEANYFVVPAGTKATITPTAYPEIRLAGTCDAKPRAAVMTQTGAVYPMPVELGAVDVKLLPGERAGVTVNVPAKKDVLLAPATAVAKGFVWVHADGKDEKRAVVTGRAEGKNVEIVSGLKEGETILTTAKAG